MKCGIHGEKKCGGTSTCWLFVKIMYCLLLFIIIVRLLLEEMHITCLVCVAFMGF